MGVGLYKTLGPAIILSGATDSNAISLHSDCAAIGIQHIGAATGTLSIQVSYDNVTWSTYQEGSTLADVPVPATTKACVYQLLPLFKYFRIHSTASQGADRTFNITGVFTS